MITIDDKATNEDAEQVHLVTGFNLKISEKDIQTLQPKTWLNDQVIYNV